MKILTGVLALIAACVICEYFKIKPFSSCLIGCFAILGSQLIDRLLKF